jgi:anti-sigma regulatory factor (Ser/Thr protein kinase)
VDAWITLPARLASVEAARQWLQPQLEAADVAPGSQFRIELVLEDLLMNVVRHGHPRPAAGDGFSLRLGAQLQSDHVLLCLEDDGVAFDPTAKPAPDIDADLDDRAIGGLGMFLVREMTDTQRYDRVDGENRFWVERLLSRPMLST